MDRMESKDIDLVYLWVDGSDPKWLEKKQLFTNAPIKNSETDAVGRYANNDELKYSLRSAEKHAPWIRNIFIVTDNQKPEWLDTDHPKIKVIDHKDIMPSEILPTFNSSVIEYFLYKIPGLSEHFLFANDDMFFNADLQPDYFFAKDGYPIVYLKRKILGKWHHMLKVMIVRNIGQYRRMVIDSMNLIEQKFGKIYSGLPHHNIDSFRKSDYRKAVEEVFNEQVEKSQPHRTRTYGDLHRSAFSYYTLAIGHAHLKYVGRKEASRILIYKHNFTEYINRYHPLLFCLNDDQYTSNKQRQQVKPFLESLFPVKSAFEK
jgi:hypothetical protein